MYEVAERPGLAYKRYRVPTPERDAKLRVMLAAPPDGIDAGGHVAIAWPVELAPAGFLMPRIDLAATVPLFQVYNPASRAQIAPGFTWRYLLRTARNVAAIVDSLHRSGYVVGDINESNLLVNKRALAVLVDCDSMQVRDEHTGVVHRGGVGKPEFTAPELQGRDLATIDRTPASDAFALAVLVFQLLCEGVHPFAGVWRGSGDPPDVAARMGRGLFPYRRGVRVTPPPHALPLDVLPPELRRLAWRTFTAGIRRPSARPTAGQWVGALERAESSLRTCARSPHHVYSDHRRRCPWCDRIDAGLPDPFPGPSGRSILERRPPPRWVRARGAIVALLGRIVRRAAHAVAATGRRAGAWVWRRVREPLGGPVPVVLAAACAVAVVPLLVLLPICACLGVPRTPKRAQIPWRSVLAPATTGRWVGVRWSLVVALAATYLAHGTIRWPLP